jgi:hypothetical protein
VVRHAVSVYNLAPSVGLAPQRTPCFRMLSIRRYVPCVTSSYMVAVCSCRAPADPPLPSSGTNGDVPPESPSAVDLLQFALAAHRAGRLAEGKVICRFCPSIYDLYMPCRTRPHSSQTGRNSDHKAPFRQRTIYKTHRDCPPSHGLALRLAARLRRPLEVDWPDGHPD